MALAPTPPRIVRVLRAAASGIVASGVDVVTLLALIHVTHAAAGVAAAIGCLAGGVANFLLCRTWAFETSKGQMIRQLVVYGLVVVGGGALMSGAVVQLATVSLGLSVLAAKGAAAVLVFLGWNYPLSSRLVFTAPSGHLDPTSPALRRETIRTPRAGSSPWGEPEPRFARELPPAPPKKKSTRKEPQL